MEYLSRQEIKEMLKKLGLNSIDRPKELLEYPFVFILPTVARRIDKKSRYPIPSSIVRVESPSEIERGLDDSWRLAHHGPYAYYGLQEKEDGVLPVLLGGQEKRGRYLHSVDSSMCLSADLQDLDKLFPINEMYLAPEPLTL